MPADVDFERDPSRYRHWTVNIEGPVATVAMSVDPAGGFGDYDLKLNSYDLSVDIELADIATRLRFEHPEVGAVVLTSGLDRVFCAGANIQMLAGATHSHKVNFCKFTNETRNSIEDATANSGQVWLAAINGTAAGGGYELALACDEIILADDRSSSVSLPEVPLLGVLPGTGGLTRLVDKRHVRRDLADVFATRAEGAKGQQALEWGLVDSLAPPSQFADHVRQRALARAAESDRPGPGQANAKAAESDPPGPDQANAKAAESDPPGPGQTGSERPGPDQAKRVTLGPLQPYRQVEVTVDRELRTATLTVRVPSEPGALEDGAIWWMLTAARELDDAILSLRFNDPDIGTWVLRTRGEMADVLAADEILRSRSDHWLAREIRLYWKRVLKRLDVSARSLIALVEPGSCFAGTLAELALAADRSYMLDGTFEAGEDGPEADADADAKPAAIQLSDANDGWYPMGNGLTRLQSRFYGHEDRLAAVRDRFGAELAAVDAFALGLVTATPDDIDWEDEVRLVLEERSSFSPDALTGMEANFRVVGPETIETKIFGRLTAWQNWIFQRPNATGPDGALQRYGTGSRPEYDKRRV